MSLPQLASAQFAEFYAAVHGCSRRPFAWQEELLDRALDDDWPEQIHVPTGLGKTSSVDVAVFTLAAQAELPPGERTARTRTFFAIDRRAVVDDVTDHAGQLQQALANATEQDGVVWVVAERLRHLRRRGEPQSQHEPETLPLAVTRMRGGVGWANRWLTAAEQPAVVVGTVDQLGSRLLFRGYGVAEGALPIDAALVGTDALWLLDEAHLAKPLVETLGALQQASVPEPVLPRRPVRTVLLSATLPDAPRDRRTLRVDQRREARHSEEARRRLAADKPLALAEVTGSPKRKRESARTDLADALVRLAETLRAEDDIQVVGVVVNTVATARAVAARLDGLGHQRGLIIGPAREADRDFRWGEVRRRAGAGRDRDAAEPYVLVATQTVEVGVDLDLDALVTEACPWDALVQRAGRVDRLGRRFAGGQPSPVAVVRQPPLHGEHDRPYGAALAATWDQLAASAEVARARPDRVQPGSPALSLSPEAAITPQHLLGVDPSELGEMLAPAPLTKTVLAQEYPWDWSRTSPQPVPDLPIAVFLHGEQEDVPRVEVAWRGGLAPERDMASEVTASLALRPLASPETLELPLWAVRRWLEGLPADEVADSTGRRETSPEDHERKSSHRPRAARVVADRRAESLRSVRELRPGDVVVVPAELGGLDVDGWAPASDEPVEDLADVVKTRSGRVIRLDPQTLAPRDPGAADRVAALLAEAREQGRSPAKPEVVAALLAAPPTEAASPAQHAWLELIEELKHEPQGRVERVPMDGQREGWRLRVPHVNEPSDRAPVERADEDDSASLAEPATEVSLTVHQQAVAERARAAAQRLGLDDRLVTAADAAARFHDLGKAEPRFQRMLRGGERLSFLSGDELLAKSGTAPAGWAAARRKAGVPARFRHEALSVALAGQLLAEWFPELDPADHELVLHLVATHHGRGRAVFPPVEELGEVQTVEVDGVDLSEDQVVEALQGWDQPARHHCLVQRHGAWGLALLETIVRLADVECSEAGT